jgi:rod shape-determining protein MreD
VKLASILLTVLVATLVQVMLARYTVGGRVVFDLVLVAVVYAALHWGPVAGMLTGTMGGLLQDLLAGDVVGVGALAKTVIGYATGFVGAQFVLSRSDGRTLMVVAATVVHRLMVLALQGLIDQAWSGVSWGAMLAETGINAMAAFLAFYASGALPGLVGRQRASRRATLGRRQW